MTARTDSPSAAVRIRVMKRDRFQCTYCGVPGTDAELEIDHIVPVARGGSHHMSNLTTACRSCNQSKSDGVLTPKRAARAHMSNGLVGIFLHTFKDGRIEWQGRIIGVDGDICLVQLFGWFHGDPTNVVPIKKAEIYSERCRLYADEETWRTAATSESRKEPQSSPRQEVSDRIDELIAKARIEILSGDEKQELRTCQLRSRNLDA
jgi:5-methylcytosine-specific restriction protein A